ncbi:hypothetical protein E0Z10_g6408 [Xylaria hypoxylon]|uniref:Integral membrane protein n=1 Tax=Xylaria hypoxylon TaxID=37992 RepID=A0A4Z0YSJ9_9PEZI|nr:hypothetical protein E0Z10_g6408 [Xylaria hypoxylon]
MSSHEVSILLRLVPVMSTTSSLWYAWDQYEQMTLFRKAELKTLSNQLLPRYFTSFFARGAPRVLGLLAATTVSCGVIIRSSHDLPANGVQPWYIAGLSLAIAHLAWVPFIISPVQAIEKDVKGESVAHLEDWLRLHVWRSLTVDLGAWMCCIVATVVSLS